MLAGGDEVPGHSVVETLAGAADRITHHGQPGALGFDEEVGERFALRGEHRDGGGAVERRGIGLPAVEGDAVGEAERGCVALAVGAGGAVAHEGEAPIQV